MDPVTPKELDEWIAELSLGEDWPPRDRLCLALIELRHARRRWGLLHFCFPWLARWMERQSKKSKTRHSF